MMESAGAAEPSSENDSIHSFTLKEWFENLIATTTAGCLQIRKEFSHSHRARSQLEGKYYFRSLLVPTIIS